MTCPSSVLDPVDHLLRMFDAEADGKGFRRQGNRSLRKFSEGVVRRLADRQYQSVRSDLSDPLTTRPTSLPLWMMKSLTRAPKRNSHPSQQAVF